MPILGETRNVAMGGAPFTDLDPAENMFPLETEIRNARVTDALHWRSRPGYSETADSGIDSRVTALIPQHGGFAIHASGHVYKLGPVAKLFDDKITGTERPSYANHDDVVIVAAGGDLHTVSSDGVGTIATAGYGIRWADVLNSRVIAAGYHPTEFKWSGVGNHNSWTDIDFTNTEGDGQEIRHFRVFSQRLFFFKDSKIEVWDNTGGQTTFSRSFVIHRGTLAGHSVVEANGGLFWFGDDGDFYLLNGTTPQPISGAIRRRLDDMTQTMDCYGLDFPTEDCIRWFFPTHGRCFRFDYDKNHFSEDNAWIGDWDRMPIASAMYHKGQMLVGDYHPTGKVYEWGQEHTSDAGTPIRMYRRATVKLDESGRAARVNRVLLRLVRGEDADSPLSSTMLFRWRMDRGTWRSRTFTLERQGSTNPYVQMRNLGTGREMEFEIIQHAPTKFIVSEMAVTARTMGA